MNHIASPDRSDNAIEFEIQAKGKTAPRVTPAALQANIASEHYFTANQGVAGAYSATKWKDCKEGEPTKLEVIEVPEALTLLTFCVLVLQNGFTVTGESACASPENYDEAIGRKIARQNAEQKIWPLMGYALKQHLHKANEQGCAPVALTDADAAADLAGTPRPDHSTV